MMDRFAPVLDRVSRGLALPEPERSRVVEEMTSDLEGLYEAYRERGMSEEEAVRRAEQALAASAEALAELSRIHAPLHRRLAEHYAEPGRHRAERWLLALLASGTVAWAAGTEVTRGRGGAGPPRRGTAGSRNITPSPAGMARRGGCSCCWRAARWRGWRSRR